MRGRRLVLVKGTTAGYVFPLEYFFEHGVEDIDKFFEEVFLLKVMMMLAGQFILKRQM